MIGIYKITSPSGRIYIGQSTNIEKRKKQYEKSNCKSQTALFGSILKYGFKNHIFEIVCECNVSELNNKERYYQDLYNSMYNSKGLNLRYSKSNDKSGYLLQSVKDKISIKKLGVVFSEKHKQSMRKNSYRKNLILDTNNGIFHESAKTAHKTYRGSYFTFIAKLNGRRKNNTGFIIV